MMLIGLGVNGQTTNPLSGIVKFVENPQLATIDTTATKLIGRKTSDGRIVRYNWAVIKAYMNAGGSTPTLQEVINSGSTATTNNTVSITHGTAGNTSSIQLTDDNIRLTAGGVSNNTLNITHTSASITSPLSVGAPVGVSDAVRVQDLTAATSSQTLQTVTNNGNNTTLGIGIGTTQTSMPAGVGKLRVGDGTNTDTYSTAAISEEKTITAGVYNGLNVELRATMGASLSTRMRAFKGAAIVDAAGFTLSNVGGGILGAEGVARSIGTSGTILVGTGLYGRVLIDGTASITNAVGLYVPVHANGSGVITNSIGASLNNQTLGVNNFNVVIGTSLATGGQAPAGITGNWSIYNMSQNPNYSAGDIIFPDTASPLGLKGSTSGGLAFSNGKPLLYSGSSISSRILTVDSDAGGITGGAYYGANYTPNTLVQKKYVDDAIAAIPSGGTVTSVTGISTDGITVATGTTTPVIGASQATSSQRGTALLYTSTGASTTGSIDQNTTTTLLAAKEPVITSGTTAQYIRGDKTLSTLNTDIGTSTFTISATLSTAPISSATTLGGNLKLLQNQINAMSAYSAKTASYTLTATDYTVTLTSGTATFTLPTAVGITGKIYIVKNKGAGVLTIATTSSQTMDGATTATISTTYAGRVLQSNGANWDVIGLF